MIAVASYLKPFSKYLSVLTQGGDALRGDHYCTGMLGNATMALLK